MRSGDKNGVRRIYVFILIHAAMNSHFHPPRNHTKSAAPLRLAKRSAIKKFAQMHLCAIDFPDRFIYHLFMADIIEFTKRVDEKNDTNTYSVDISQYPDNLMFTVNGIEVSPESLSKIADQLERIAQIIRTDVVTRVV